MKKDLQYIVNHLPYKAPFLFFDELTQVDENGASGHYTFSEDSEFYQGHFPDHPITPGVLLTECMAQIGLVSLGIFLLSSEEVEEQTSVALSETNIEFLKGVNPGETVYVQSEKIYFRFGKLKCKVRMTNAKDELVCKGIISGMVFQKKT